MHATEHIKIYHNNGKHDKLASGTWPEARRLAAKKMSRLSFPLRGDENIEVEIWTHGQRTTVKSRSWNDLLTKMGDADASTTLVFVFAMTAWVAAFQVVLPFIGGF